MAKDKIDKLEETLTKHITLTMAPVNTHIIDQKRINDQVFSKTNKLENQCGAIKITVAEKVGCVDTKVEKVKSSLTTAKVIVGFVLTGLGVLLTVLAFKG